MLSDGNTLSEQRVKSVFHFRLQYPERQKKTVGNLISIPAEIRSCMKPDVQFKSRKRLWNGCFSGSRSGKRMKYAGWALLW